MRAGTRRRDASGMSLAGLLVIVVVLGGLAAAAVVGVNSMTSDNATVVGTSPSTTAGGGGGAGSVGLGGIVAAAAASACNAAAATATAASSAYFASSGAGAYPTKWSDLTASAPPIYALPAHVVIDPKNPAALDGNGWRLTMSGGGTTAPAFACKYPSA